MMGVKEVECRRICGVAVKIGCMGVSSATIFNDEGDSWRAPWKALCSSVGKILS